MRNVKITDMTLRQCANSTEAALSFKEKLEVAGIVGQAHGSKPREVLCISEEDLQLRLDSMR